MTTITIKENLKLSKTEFQSIEEFLDWAVEYFQDEPPLSKEIIEKAEMAKKELLSANSAFREVT